MYHQLEIVIGKTVLKKKKFDSQEKSIGELIIYFSI